MDQRIVLHVCSSFLKCGFLLLQMHQERHRRFCRRLRLGESSTRHRSRHLAAYECLLATTFRLLFQAPTALKLRIRTLRALPRSTEWWYVDVLQKYNEDQWKENFRMTKETFMKLCRLLDEELRPHIHAFGKILSVQQKVAMSLYKLGSCAELRVVANQFGVHRSTVGQVLRQFCSAVNSILMPYLVQFPNEVECAEIAQAFKQKCKIPQIIGAIDGSHIPVLAPAEGYRDYVNRKGWTSLVLQAVVDHRGLFRDITCQHPGVVHDATVFADSNLYKNANTIIPKGHILINNVRIPYMILCDAAYPGLPWTLVPFKKPQSQEPMKESYNVYHSSGRICVEQAFGRLKGRFRCLLKRLDLDVGFIPKVVATCCTLHNFIETNNDRFVPQWLAAVEEADVIYQQPNDMNPDRFERYEANVTRSAIVTYLADNFHARISSLRYELATT